MRKSIWLLLMLTPYFSRGQEEVRKELQREFIEVKNGSTITLPAGTFRFDASVWLDDKTDILIKGSGQDKTILTFKNQRSGAEGIKITNASNITIQDLTIQDTRGDAIKAQHVDGITFRNIKVEWTGGPNEENGSYGLYPVQCMHVIIERCTAIAASDAGVYVGQSKYIKIHNCEVYQNVAGIEIENSLYADVYNNNVYSNTGGILVFDLPGLTLKKGGHVRIFDNHVHENNLDNFAPKGNIVAKIPPGTGIMVLATKAVEIFQNKIINNITAGTVIVSYHIAELPINDKEYDPYPGKIFIHDNLFKRPRVRATWKGRMGMMFRVKLRYGKDVPHILFDGIPDPKTPNREICLANNENATFGNMDAANGFKNKSRDDSHHRCTLTPLSPVAFNE